MLPKQTKGRSVVADKEAVLGKHCQYKVKPPGLGPF